VPFPKTKYRDQRIAVFGESGSGKTVLLSSFYGSAQEPEFLHSSQFKIGADNPGQGTRLYQMYLEMRDKALAPEVTRVFPETYSFSVTVPKVPASNKKGQPPFDALRLSWFDYPGEWFEEDTPERTEAIRKSETFKNLLESDVAFLLVDGQRLIDHAGEEQKYLKSLFHNYRTGLAALQDRLMPNGDRLERFPRIWVLALTKTDLFDDLDVYGFRDLVIGNAGGDLAELRNQIATFVEDSDALSVGDDFLMLSSARFEFDKIEVDRRIGVDLILPLAAILPFERHVWWASKKMLPGQVAEQALEQAGSFAVALLDISNKIRVDENKNPLLASLLGFLKLVKREHVEEAFDLVGEKLEEANRQATANHDHLVATLTGFKIALENAEKSRMLLRGPQ
jgi:hypothetical protein